MLSWRICCSSIFIIVCFTLGSHGQSVPNVPNDPLWPLFTELLSSQTGRTVEDINILGLSDVTINAMWTSYQASMPKLETPTQQATPIQQSTPPPTPELYQPSYSFSSQPSGQAASNDLANMAQQIMSMLTPNSNTGPTTTNAGTSSSQDMLKAYQNIMSSGGTGTNPMSMMNQLMTGSPSSTSTSTSPSYNDLMGQYQAIMGQAGGAGASSMNPSLTPTSTSTAVSSPPSPYQQMMSAYSQIMGGQSSSLAPSSSTSTINQLMNKYSNILSGQYTGLGGNIAPTPSPSPMDQMMTQYSQLMGGQTGSGGTLSLDQLVATYNQMMGVSGGQYALNQMTGGQPNAGSSSTAQTPGVPDASVDTGAPLSVDVAPTNNVATSQQQQQPSPSTPTASSASTFDQQLVELFPQFKNVMPSSSLSVSSSSSTPAPPDAASAPTTSDNSSIPQNAADISKTNSAQQIFDVLLFGKKDQPAGQTNTVAPPVTNNNNNNNNNNPTPAKTPLEQHMDLKNKMLAKSPGKLLSTHMENVWKTRASRDMGCRFLPELLELDILPTMPLECRNKCPFPYVNAQKFGVYCVCCPPGVNDQIVSALSILRRPSFIKDNPLAVVS